MRFQVQMLCVAAICAVLFHGALSAPSPNVDDDVRSDSALTADDDNDEVNPLVVAALKWAAKELVKKVGCAVAVKHAQSCGVRDLFIPLDRLAEDNELDQGVIDVLKAFGCKAAGFIRNFC